MNALSSKRRITSQIRRLGVLAKAKGYDAATVVGTALALWCELDYPALDPAKLPQSHALSAEQRLRELVASLRELSFLEAAYWLSSAYAMLEEADYRKKLAMFFTPVSLTEGLLRDLADRGVDFADNTFFDPACGGAAFLVPIAQRMRASLCSKGLCAKQVLDHFEAHLFGTDLDNNLCELSKHFLCMTLYFEISETGRVPDFKVHVADSLIDLTSMLGTIDVVVCNPPYRKVSAQELEPIRFLYEDVIEAQPNLYGLFIGLCVRLIREGGYVALVTPTSFLSGQNFGQLRTFLLRNTEIEHIGLVSC